MSNLKSGVNIAPNANLNAILSCLCYSLMSNFMVLVNRYIVGTQYYAFDYKIFVVFIQAFIAVLILEITKAQGFINYEQFHKETARRWLPVTLFFILMLYTATEATSKLPIHIVTVFKNVTNILIVAGEWKFFSQSVSPLVIVSLLVMLGGAVLASFSDISSSSSRELKESGNQLLGYFWMFMNCACTASYVLYMRFATSRQNSVKLSKFAMAFYNNLLALPLLMPFMILDTEIFTVWSDPLLHNFSFLSLLILSGCFGIILNLTSFWCVSVTTATTYATVGALNKIPTTFIGVLFLHEALNAQTATYVTFGMIGGILYGYAKYKESEDSKKKKMKDAVIPPDQDLETTKMLNKA